jgi:hypothetical protein
MEFDSILTTILGSRNLFGFPPQVDNFSRRRPPRGVVSTLVVSLRAACEKFRTHRF